MRHLLRLFFVCLIAPLSRLASAQGTQEDYERGPKLAALWQDKVLNAAPVIRWLEGTPRFWYRKDLWEGAREYILVDAAKPARGPAFDHAKLAEALAKVLGKPVAANRLSLDRLELPADGLLFDTAGARYRCDLATYELKKIGAAQPPARDEAGGRRGGGGGERRFRGPGGNAQRNDASPDGKFTIGVKNNNLFLRAKAGDEETQLTRDGTADDSYERGVFWAPDSKTFIGLRTRKQQEHLVYTIESSPRDQLQPKLHQQQYLKPGDQIAASKPHLFSVTTKAEVAVKDALFATPWSIDNSRWSADSSRFTFLFNQRGHQAMRVIAIDSSTGAASAIINEEAATFIDYTRKTFYYPLDETGEILWASERSGWNHLYLCDAKTGQVKNAITAGNWVMRGVDRVDAKTRQIWFRAGGIYPEQDPYYVHYARVNFDGKGLTLLTAGDGTHRVEYSPDGKYLIDRYSRVDLPIVTELRSAEDGHLIYELEKPDSTALVAAGWKPPERFVAKGRDGKTDIYGIIHRPSNFDPARKYPVIEDIYAGPHDSFVPKGFQPSYRQQALAELGFIVVQIDGMGTNNRNKAFHDVCWKNLVDSGFPDRIAWMKSAAEKYPPMDLSRVGIYGGSAGGQSALAALLTHGEFYKAAVADCGCHDNRMDKIWWNEQWMGWPVGPHYAEQSNVTLAPRLTGKLLLLVGELDTNVDPASTMQVCNALIKANKDFDLVIFPGSGHGAGGAYADRRRKDFFVRNLLHVEPRATASKP